MVWQLAEGDLLPGGETVLSIQRNAATGAVRYATDDGGTRVLDREARVVVARRVVEDALLCQRRRVGWFG